MYQTIKKNILKLSKNKNVSTLIYISLGLTMLYGIYYFLFEYGQENFSSKNKNIIFFYLPGCSHCEKVKPVWEQIKNEYSGNSSITLTDIDGSSDETTASKYGVEGYPTFIFLESGVKKQVYDGDRSLESLREFVNQSVSS